MIGDKKSGDFYELARKSVLHVARSSRLGNRVRSLYLFIDGIHLIIVNNKLSVKECRKAVYDTLDDHSIYYDGTEILSIEDID